MCSLRIGVQHHSMCDLPSVPRLLQWVFKSCFNILTISFWCTGNEKAVPCDILQLKGVAHLLFHNTPSVSIPATPRSDGPAAEADEIGVLASAVLSRAAIHRTDASDTRLTVGPPKTAQNLSSKNKFPNLTKATQLLAERNKKKVSYIYHFHFLWRLIYLLFQAEARLREGEEHVTIVASLWHLDGRLKPTEVSPWYTRTSY